MQTYELGKVNEVPVTTLDEAVRIHQESSHTSIAVFQGPNEGGQQVVLTDDPDFAEFFQTVMWVN